MKEQRIVVTCGDWGISVGDLATGDRRPPGVTGSKRRSPMVTGDQIGVENQRAKNYKGFGAVHGSA